jgi:hypothetical protein
MQKGWSRVALVREDGLVGASGDLGVAQFAVIA